AGTRLRLVRPSHITKVAIAASFATITWSAAFLLALYPRLPWLLPVHFKPNGFPNGWQFKTYWRVLMPVFVQVSLTLVLLAIGALLLSRPHGDHDENAPDVRAASAAAEAVALLDRKSTRLNSSHVKISYAVFCLKKKKTTKEWRNTKIKKKKTNKSK